MKAWIVGAIIGSSLGWNVYQGTQLSKLGLIGEISYQKDSLISNGYDELLVSYLHTMRDQNLEIIKGQGRIEGIVSVISNFKPEDNQHSSIWHAGYNRGSETAEYARAVFYKEGYHKACEDLNCPAKGEFPEERKKKIDSLKKELDNFDKIDTGLKTDTVVEKQ